MKLPARLPAEEDGLVRRHRASYQACRAALTIKAIEYEHFVRTTLNTAIASFPVSNINYKRLKKGKLRLAKIPIIRSFFD
jgi:hypothetical protein